VRTGGTCAYSVEVSNNTTAPIQATAFSTVERRAGLDFATFFEATRAEGGVDVTRPGVDLPAGGRAMVHFAFEVAPTPGRDAQTPLCVRLNLGFDPFPLFDAVRTEPLFCLQPTESGFDVTSAGPQ
jgi:hypothetical protein